jgi:hypothetical protein
MNTQGARMREDTGRPIDGFENLNESLKGLWTGHQGFIMNLSGQEDV